MKDTAGCADSVFPSLHNLLTAEVIDQAVFGIFCRLPGFVVAKLWPVRESSSSVCPDAHSGPHHRLCGLLCSAALPSRLPTKFGTPCLLPLRASFPQRASQHRCETSWLVFVCSRFATRRRSAPCLRFLLVASELREYMACCVSGIRNVSSHMHA